MCCLEIIDKISSICKPEVLSKIISPQTIAQFLYDNINSDESIYVCIGMRLVEMTIEKLSKLNTLYLKCMVREGVFEQIKQLQSNDYLETKFSKQLDNWISINNPYVEYFRSYHTTTHKKTKENPKGNFIKPKFLEYIAYKAGKLLAYCNTLKDSKEFKEAQAEFFYCQNVVSNITKLLEKGNLGKEKEWVELFKTIATRVIPLFTAYEARSTTFILNLFYSLCIMPSEYEKIKKKTLEESKEESLEVEIRNFIKSNPEDLKQITMRHRAFMKVFSEICNIFIKQ